MKEDKWHEKNVLPAKPYGEHRQVYRQAYRTIGQAILENM